MYILPIFNCCRFPSKHLLYEESKDDTDKRLLRMLQAAHLDRKDDETQMTSFIVSACPAMATTKDINDLLTNIK